MFTLQDHESLEQLSSSHSTRVYCLRSDIQFLFLVLLAWISYFCSQSQLFLFEQSIKCNKVRDWESPAQYGWLFGTWQSPLQNQLQIYRAKSQNSMKGGYQSQRCHQITQSAKNDISNMSEKPRNIHPFLFNNAEKYFINFGKFQSEIAEMDGLIP